MLTTLNWPTLQSRRKVAKLLVFHKALHHQIAISLPNYLNYLKYMGDIWPTSTWGTFGQQVHGRHLANKYMGDVWPTYNLFTVQLRGCFYHLTQATWRKIQELGLVPQYRDDEEFKLFCGQLDSLAFLLFDDITAGMIYLREITTPDAEPLTYVTGTYRRVGAGHGPPAIRARCVPPRFLLALWNVCETRTNNQCDNKVLLFKVWLTKT